MPAGTSTNRERDDHPDAVVRAFTQVVAARPDEPLIVGARGRVTPHDLQQGAARLADQLATRRLPDGGTVALAVPNGPGFLAALLALRRRGHPVLLLDHAAPAIDRGRAVEALGAAAVLECNDAWSLDPSAFRVLPLHSPPVAAPTGVAVIKLTSGSTGSPRGVAMTAEQLLADESALARTMGLTERDRLLAMVPMSHSYGFTTLALSALARGLALILPTDSGPLAPIDAARHHAATVVPTVPAYIRALLGLSTPPAWPATLRLVITAGAVLHAAPAVAFRRRYGRPIHVFYGSSECGGITYDREGHAAERGSVGTPVDGVTVSLKDTESGEGLVSVSSPAVGLSYIPDPDRRLANGIFETSDIGTWRDGELALLRRADGVINVRGRKVDPAEVERVLLSLTGVEDAAVVPGDGPGRDTVVRAFVACRDGGLDYERVWRWCQAHLADHKVPRSIVFVGAIPRTGRGKVDRRALDALAPAAGSQRSHA